MSIDILFIFRAFYYRSLVWSTVNVNPFTDPNFFRHGSRIRIKEFNPKKWFLSSGLFIPDPGSGSWLFTHLGFRIPDPRFRGSKRHRIPDPDPQH